MESKNKDLGLGSSFGPGIELLVKMAFERTEQPPGECPLNFKNITSSKLEQ